MATQTKTASGKILNNSLWYGLETLIETVVFLGTSIAVARYLGPEKLGYFSYINLFVTILTRTSGTGLSTATRKYMSEYIALDQLGTARAVYNLAHRYQLIGAVIVSAFCLLGILLFGDPAFKLMSSILILSIIPGLMSWVPAQANSAFEDVSNNTLSAFGYIVAYTTCIVLTVHFRWDLVGVASASLIGRTVEVFLRTIPLNRALRKLPLDTLKPDLIQRIRRFCIQAGGLQILESVVWDRSEMFFLRAFSNLSQMGFYSVSFTFANNLLMFARVFGGSTGITLMVEAGRDPKRIDAIVKTSSRYLLLVSLPVSLGAVAITFPTIAFVYGTRYLGAVPAMMIAAILCIPRAFQWVPETLMRSADRQDRIIVWYCVTGAINIALDALLIPHYGAAGAAWGNGLSQTFGVVAIWSQSRQFYTFKFPTLAAIRLLGASLIMAAIAYVVGHKIPGPAGLLLAVVTAFPIYIILIKLFQGLEASDRPRLNLIGTRMPGLLRRPYLATIAFLVPVPL